MFADKNPRRWVRQIGEREYAYRGRRYWRRFRSHDTREPDFSHDSEMPIHPNSEILAYTQHDRRIKGETQITTGLLEKAGTSFRTA